MGLTQVVALSVGLGLSRLLLDKEAASYYQVCMFDHMYERFAFCVFIDD